MDRGRAPLPAALRPLRLLARPREAGGAALRPLPRLRVAAEPPVPAVPGVRGAAAAHPLRQRLRLRLRHLPVQQREGEEPVQGEGKHALALGLAEPARGEAQVPEPSLLAQPPGDLALRGAPEHPALAGFVPPLDPPLPAPG